MDINNKRGQVLIEAIFIFALFISLLSAVQLLAQRQQKILDESKLSKKIYDSKRGKHEGFKK